MTANEPSLYVSNRILQLISNANAIQYITDAVQRGSHLRRTRYSLELGNHSAMKQYLDMLRHTLDNGVPHQDRTGVGTVSVFGYQARFDLRAGFPLLTTKTVPLRWVFEELRWFLTGSVQESDLRAAGVDIWKEWSDEETCGRFNRKAGDLGPIYGHQWRNFGATPKQIGRASCRERV